MQLAENRFKAAIRAGRPQLGLWSNLCSNLAAEVIATAGYDWILLDMEHAPNDLATVLSQLQALAAGPAMPIVRPPWNEPVMVKRLLDLGVFTLLFPMVQSAEEAAAAVASTRYPPDGIRGVALSHRGNRFGQIEDYFSRVGAELCVLVQIETRAALERIDEIAAVDGVDGVFFGPADLSADMGLLGQPGHPEVSAAIALGFDRMRATGKAAGILTGDPGQAAGWLQAGFTFVACGSDTAVLARGTRSLLEQVRQRAGQ